MKSDIFLIIGSNSFSGSNFVNFLLNKKFKVIGVSRSDEKKILNPYKNNKNLKKYHFFKIDINHDQKKLIKIIKKFKPNYIINFTAQGMVNESWNNPDHWYQTNVVSMVNLIQEIKQLKFINLFLNFSTPEVYGNIKNLKKEDNHFVPTTPYAISRAAFDLHLHNLYRFYKFPVIITRTANVFGPYQDLYRLIPKTIISILKKKRVQIHGKGETVRSFIFIEDVNNALMKIIKQGKIGQTYHISTKEFISIRKICETIKKKMKIKNDFQFTKDRTGKDFAYKLDSGKLNKGLKWKPKYNLNDSLDLTINWYYKNFKILKNKKLSYEHKK
jgi:dTDP-glucose 4,6-dehydratase